MTQCLYHHYAQKSWVLWSRCRSNPCHLMLFESEIILGQTSSLNVSIWEHYVPVCLCNLSAGVQLRLSTPKVTLSLFCGEGYFVPYPSHIWSVYKLWHILHRDILTAKKSVEKYLTERSCCWIWHASLMVSFQMYRRSYALQKHWLLTHLCLEIFIPSVVLTSGTFDKLLSYQHFS